MINQRLFTHYGIDTNKNLQIKRRCPRPYDTILIDKQGSCFACECQSWLPQSVGNLQIRTLSEIIDSPMQKHLQASIADGTYRYCNEHQCSYIMSNTVLNDRPSRIKHLRLAIDDSCNLRCPSCRKGMIFHKEGSAYRLGIRLADRINDWLHGYEHPIQVHGATKHTYEKLRLGGKWEKILEALECMAEQKQRHGFRFILHYVVQKDNFHEMQEIIDLGEQFDADRVWLNRIEDWGTMDDFQSQDIWSTKEYLDELDKVRHRRQQRGDRFIECPTLLK